MDWRLAYSTNGSLALREPDDRFTRRSFWGYILLALCIPLVARLCELPLWDGSRMVGGERLLADPAAYALLAGGESAAGKGASLLSRFLHGLGALPGLNAATVAFWLPLAAGCLLSVVVFLWAAAFGMPNAGLLAGALASLAPGVLTRTMLGSCDARMAEILLVFLLGFAPMLWLRPWLHSPLVTLYRYASCTGAALASFFAAESGGERRRAACKAFCERRRRLSFVLPSASRPARARGLAFFSLIVLALAGFVGWLVLPYSPFVQAAAALTALLAPVLVLLFGPPGGRLWLLGGALCFSLPLLGGWAGLGGGVFLAYAQGVVLHSQAWVGMAARLIAVLCRIVYSPVVLLAAWSGVAYLAYGLVLHAVDGSVLSLTAAYSDAVGPPFFPGADAVPLAPGESTAVNVLPEGLHPWSLLLPLAAAGTLVMFLVFPATLYLAVPLGLALSGYFPDGFLHALPVLALGLVLGGVRLGGDLILVLFDGVGRDPDNAGYRWPLEMRSKAWQRMYGAFAWSALGRMVSPSRILCAIVCAIVLIRPVTARFPEYTAPPAVSRDMAEAFFFLRDHTGENAIVWNWWRWGDVARHFSGRNVVSSSGRNFGMNLYLPALVYTSADASAARAIMQLANDPEHSRERIAAISGLDDDTVRTMLEAMPSFGDDSAGRIKGMERRGSEEIPAPAVIPAYLVVSLDMVPLIPEISLHGSWNFAAMRGERYAVTGPFGELSGNYETGAFNVGGSLLNAVSVDVFGIDGMQRHRYYRLAGDRYFVVDARGETPQSYALRGKAVSTLLYRLLTGDPLDPAIAASFKLVFSNATARVFEVVQE